MQDALRRSGLTALCAALACAVLLAVAGPARAQSAETAWRLIDYIAVDYAAAVDDGGRVVNAGEYAEMREFSGAARDAIAALPSRPEQAALVSQAAALQAAVERKAPPRETSAQARRLGASLLALYPAQVAPTSPPDLARGAALYAERCAACHGAAGAGDGVLAAGLDPPPIAFTDAARARERSLFALYQVIGEGLGGTAMAGFGDLSAADRWALAFYAGQFASSDADAVRGERLWRNDRALRARFAGLRAVTEPTPAALADEIGEANAAALTAYLRRHPEALAAASSPLGLARERLAASVSAYEAGARNEASALALSAYLDGFEAVEATLAVRDARLVQRVETAMAEYRSAVSGGAPLAQVRERQAAVLGLLDDADARLAPAEADFGATFASAFAILLREGLEALLIVVAILAFLEKAERRDLGLYVHGGWVFALAAGAATWAAATYMITISGASREMTEGFGSLIAALVLVSVGVWMHTRSRADAWRGYVRERLSRVLSGGSVWLLFLLSFVVVYREVFETILFYVALWAQDGGWAIAAGAGAAAVCLAASAWLLLFFSRRLPISQFFAFSSVLIAALAVVLVGKGVAALQEAGVLSVHAAPFAPRIDMLGLFPTWEGLVAQLAAVIAIAAGFLAGDRTARGAAAG